MTKQKKIRGGASPDRLGAKKSRGEAERMECGLVKIKEEEEATGPHNIAGMMWGYTHAAKRFFFILCALE